MSPLSGVARAPVIDFNTLTTARGGTAPLLDAHVLSESLAFTDASQIIRLSHQQESVSLTDTQRAAVTKIERARLTIGETRETTVDRTTGERVSLTDARRAAVTRTAREQLTLTEQSTRSFLLCCCSPTPSRFLWLMSSR